MDRDTVERVRKWIGLVRSMKKVEILRDGVYIMQEARMLLCSFIVILSRASPQSDAQHDGRIAGVNGSIISWPPDARQS